MSDEHGTVEFAQDPGHSHEPHPTGLYMRVFYALCVFTALSVGADLLGGISALTTALGQMNVKVLVGLIVLAIACCKATFVMLYFMHLKFEGKWKYVLLAPTIVLAMAIIAALMPDIGVHYYTVQTPQTSAAAMEEANASPPHTGQPEPPGHH